MECFPHDNFPVKLSNRKLECACTLFYSFALGLILTGLSDYYIRFFHP